MAAPAFDTLRFQQKLSEVLEPRTATVMAEAFEEATRNFAAKSDLDALRQELKADGALLRQEVRSEIAALRAELSDKLRAQTFSLVAAVAAIMGVAVAVLKLTA